MNLTQGKNTAIERIQPKSQGFCPPVPVVPNFEDPIRVIFPLCLDGGNSCDLFRLVEPKHIKLRASILS